MKTAKNLLHTACAVVALGAGSVTAWAQPTPGAEQSRSVLILGATAHLGTGDVLEDCAVGFRDGEIDYVGRSFQVNRQKYDDILDATATDEQLGKPAGLVRIGAAHRPHRSSGIHRAPGHAL